MLYFAYGSNLNRKQMKRRCKDSLIKKKTTLKNYQLTFRSKYGAADIDKKKNSKVYGAVYEISKSDEKRLDLYEEYPNLYKKKFFRYNNKLAMFYIMEKKSKRTPPTARYLKTIKQGYKDWKINVRSLNAALLTLKYPQQK